MHEYVKNGEESGGSRSHRESGTALKVRVRKVTWQAPGRWLVGGFRDIPASGYRSLFYGMCFVLMGLGIDSAHVENPAVALGLSAAFLFTGPFLSMGIYELSRQLQAGERPDLLLSLFSWCRNPAAAGRFAFFLSVVMVLWLGLSSTLLEAAGDGPDLLFALALLVWALLALSVLMASAVAIPMLLDQTVSALEAVRSSVACFMRNKLVLSFWFLIVALAVILSLSLQYWPLLLLGPWLGHATWHSYEECLDRT
ncbi:DUF2189 domain-containing protein [Granulosicoccus sp. 3-233]|uniref:DUF2189 domain-containing protein n=1 Tax=Granulosicoccus sp. 3-233 TaxID=3417969 RepID=UPI003D346638